MSSSNVNQLAARYRDQIDAEFRNTKSQTTNETKHGRRVQIDRLKSLVLR